MGRLPRQNPSANVRRYRFGNPSSEGVTPDGGAPSIGMRAGGRAPRMSGRKVPGKGNKDTVPATLTPGEFVSTKAATRRHEPTLRRWNQEARQGGR